MAKVDNRFIVLDLNKDVYIGLDNNLGSLLTTFSDKSDNRAPKSIDKSVIKLLNKGLIAEQHGSAYRRASRLKVESKASVPRPTASLWSQLSDEKTSEVPIALNITVSALVCLTAVATSLRMRNFRSTIHFLAKTKVNTPDFQETYSHHTLSSFKTLQRAQYLVNAFDEARPYFPLTSICRLDAPSLCLHLRRNGQSAQLIFGVRLDPFAAHCWVQIGDIAISEPWARVRQYTPILIV